MTNHRHDNPHPREKTNCSPRLAWDGRKVGAPLSPSVTFGRLNKLFKAQRLARRSLEGRI